MRTVLDVADEWEPRLHAELVRLLRQVLAATAKVMGMTAAAGEPYVSLDDLARIPDAWAAQVGTLEELLALVFADGAETLGELPGESVLTVRSLAAARHLALAEPRLRHVGNVLWQQARRQLLEGFQRGESIPQLQTRVRKALRVSEHVATAVARTEVIAASNGGAIWQAKQLAAAGVGPATKTWLATADSRTRRDHRAADGQTVPVDQPFIVGGYALDYPGDPAGPDREVWNCRCTVIWDTDERVQEQLQERQERFEGPLVAAGGDTVSDVELDDEVGALLMEPVHGVLIVEATLSGDSRIFDADALVWRELPLPIAYQTLTAEGHDQSALVGRIDELWREGNEIRFRGVLNVAEPTAAKAFQEIESGMIRGISADLDDIGESDIEMVWPDDEALMPEEIRFSHARVMGGTIVMHPAFQEAYIAVGDFEPDVKPDEIEEPEPEPEPMLAAAGVKFQTSTAVNSNLMSWLPTRNGLTLQPGEMVVSERDLTAAAGYRRPSSALFANPGLKEPTPHSVSDDGTRVFGHLALWRTCHIGIQGQCVTPPREDEMAYFLLKDLVTDEGDHVAVGQLTFGTGHAGSGLSAAAALEHYDNTGTVVADVACGADQYGIWYSGAVRPDVRADPVKLDAFRGAVLSGDWRRIGNQLRLVAALCVNVPGFPIPRTRTRTRGGTQTALVAAGILDRAALDAAACMELAEREARRIGRDRGARAREQAARVHGRG